MTKKISKSQMIGQKGVNLIEKLVLDLGFTWHPTGTFDAGVDGFIEIRNPETGEMTNCVILAQSKASERNWVREDDAGFEYACEQRDVDYWLQGNTPVILIVSRPSAGIAYWKDVKSWFGLPSNRKSTIIRFSKATDRFDASCREALIRLAVDRSSGLYLPPRPLDELLVTNLLPMRFETTLLYRAPARFSTRREAKAALRDQDLWLPQEWIIRGGEVYSFHDLVDDRWDVICESDRSTEFELASWANSEDRDVRWRFVELIHLALQEHLYPTVRRRIERGRHLYLFTPEPGRDTLRVPFAGFARQSSMTVVTTTMSTKDPTVVYARRSHAVDISFRRFDGTWFAELMPTYWYATADGAPHPRADDLLAGIKRIEKHLAVRGQLMLWRERLKEPHGGQPLLKARRSFLRFGPDLATVSVDRGFDDSSWKQLAEDEVDLTSDDDLESLGIDPSAQEDDDGASGDQLNLFGGGRS